MEEREREMVQEEKKSEKDGGPRREREGQKSAMGRAKLVERIC